MAESEKATKNDARAEKPDAAEVIGAAIEAMRLDELAGDAADALEAAWNGKTLSVDAAVRAMKAPETVEDRP